MHRNFNYSVIIPHHNIPNLLQRCLDSIPRRNDIQIIVVDDNSNPEFVDFDKFPGMNDSSVEVYLTKEGKGAGYARNVGLKYAKGIWIIFADADDFFVPNAFSIIDNYLDNNADMILFKSQSVDSETFEVMKRNVTTNSAIDEYLEGRLTAKNVALRYYVPWGRMIKSNFIRDNDIHFDEIVVSNDVMFATKAACNTDEIQISSNIIYCITFRKGSLWNSKRNIDIRIKTHIRRNNYILKYGYKEDIIPVIVCIHKWCKHSLKLYLKCLYIAISSGVLFQGFFLYIKRKMRNKKFHN